MEDRMNDELMKLLKKEFNKDILDIEEIEGGWLTEKWKIQFKDVTIMLKVIEHKKINRRDINIELAANLLKKAYDFGIKCPRIFKVNDRLVNYNKNNNPMVVIEYLEETFSKDYTNINNGDIYSIGAELAKLRKCFNEINIDKKIDYHKIIEKMHNEYNKRLDEGKYVEYLNDVLKQKRILDLLNYDFLKNFEIGYCHGDLSQDNILFDKNGFRALVDFEIANLSFVLRDIARIFLTFCLDNNGKINKELLKNLMDGYNRFGKLTFEDLINGIKILWCLEVNLWIKEAYYIDNTPEKVKKFMYEINWITDNWFDLENIIKI